VAGVGIGSWLFKDSQSGALESDNNLTTPLRPFMVAYDRGVRPLLSGKPGLISQRSRSSPTKCCGPYSAANDKGVRPLLFGEFGSTSPRSRSIFITFSCPAVG